MNWWILFAGLWLIRFGLEMFEEALKKLWWPKLSLILQRYTDKWRKATLVGTIVTGILNSSTLVSLLTLGFVSAGMMKLINAVWVLVGANIWSTATGMIVWYLWFGEFKISMFAIPLIAIGGVIMILTSKKPRTFWSKLLIGFGLFFLGIDFLKENMEVMSEVFDFAKYKDMNLWIFGLIGMIVTAMIQSSGAVGVMTLAALHSGIITFEAGFAIILWANIGTTFTALVASLSGSVARRQIGVANVLFNIITVGIGIILFQPYIRLTLDVLWFHNNLAIGNAVINLIFNATTSIAFIPFLWWFVWLIKKIIPDKAEVYPLQIVHHPITDQSHDEAMIDIYINALESDRLTLRDQVVEYVWYIWSIDTKSVRDGAQIVTLKKFDNDAHRDLYDTIKNQLDIILPYIQHLHRLNTDKEHEQRIDSLLRVFIAMSNTIKSTKNIRDNITTMREAIDPKLIEIYSELRHLVAQLLIHNYHDTDQIRASVYEIKTYRNDIISRVSSMITNGNVWPMDLSSLVNMTGELVDVAKSNARMYGVDV